MKAYALIPILLLAACDELPVAQNPATPAAEPAVEEAAAVNEPVVVEEPAVFTLGPQDELQPPGAGKVLGKTVSSLGDPERGGDWIETPLVKKQGPGLVRYNGKTVPVLMIPAEGPASGGSRLSLSAMRALGAPVTELVEVEVVAS